MSKYDTDKRCSRAKARAAQAKHTSTKKSECSQIAHSAGLGGVFNMRRSTP